VAVQYTSYAGPLRCAGNIHVSVWASAVQQDQQSPLPAGPWACVHQTGNYTRPHISGGYEVPGCDVTLNTIGSAHAKPLSHLSQFGQRGLCGFE